MKNNDLERTWQEIERKKSSSGKMYQRMICIDMLYRVYIGSVGIPSRRYLSIEIPEIEAHQFDTFSTPKGFSFTLNPPSITHDGFAECILQASSHDQNDVFTIVVLDILHELSKQKLSAEYVNTLKQRIEKWRDFFRNPSNKRLSKEMALGLWGELHLIYKLHSSGISTISDLWSGPIKSAQDFQGHDIALEVKTTVSNQLDRVNISSEVQLDDSGYQALYLAALRVEQNDASGITLPQLIDTVASCLTEPQKNRLFAALLCMGYSPDDADLYNKGYVLKEQNNYLVKDGFPRLLRRNMPQGVHDLKYSVSLSNCSAYLVEWDSVVAAIKEYEYGQS